MTEYAGAICGPAMEEFAREFGGVHWCFVCRKHRPFWRVWTHTIEPSYYDPNVSMRCEGCNGIDADLFPGRVREWVEG